MALLKTVHASILVPTTRKSMSYPYLAISLPRLDVSLGFPYNTDRMVFTHEEHKFDKQTAGTVDI